MLVDQSCVEDREREIKRTYARSFPSGITLLPPPPLPLGLGLIRRVPIASSALPSQRISPSLGNVRLRESSRHNWAYVSVRSAQHVYRKCANSWLRSVDCADSVDGSCFLNPFCAATLLCADFARQRCCDSYECNSM